MERKKTEDLKYKRRTGKKITCVSMGDDVRIMAQYIGNGVLSHGVAKAVENMYRDILDHRYGPVPNDVPIEKLPEPSPW